MRGPGFGDLWVLVWKKSSRALPCLAMPREKSILETRTREYFFFFAIVELNWIVTVTGMAVGMQLREHEVEGFKINPYFY